MMSRYLEHNILFVWSVSVGGTMAMCCCCNDELQLSIPTSHPTSPAQLQLASHPYYLSWQYNHCFLPMLLNVFLLALIASFSLHCTSKWVWQITTIYLPRYTGFLCPPASPPSPAAQHSRLGNLISQKLTSTLGTGTKSSSDILEREICFTTRVHVPDSSFMRRKSKNRYQWIICIR